MATPKVEDILKRSLDLLNARQFNDALTYLQHQAKAVGMPEFADQVEPLRVAYDQLVSQFIEANLESQSEDEYSNLILQFYDKLQALCTELATKTYVQTIPLEIPISRLIHDKSDKALCELFLVVKTTGPYSEEYRSMLHQFIMDENIPVYMRCTILSAIMLHMFNYFDTEMLENVYAYTLDDQPDQIRWQAWVTIFLCAVVHPVRIEYCDKIRQQYKFLAESEPDLFFSMQMTLLQCKEAQGIHDKVAKMLAKKGDDDNKTKQIFQLFAEGPDLSYDSFKMMRHMPFFSDAEVTAHWLMPFSVEQEAIKKILKKNPQIEPMVSLLSKSIAQSEQDKYGSVIMLLGSDMNIIGQITDRFKEVGLEIDKVMTPSGEVLMRNYMHDIYRYFTLSPMGVSSTVSPFKENLDMSRVPWLEAALGTSKAMSTIGEYMIHNERWNDAVTVFSRLANKDNSEYALQRLAYAAENRETRNMQLECDPLIKCNKLYPGNTWTLCHLAKFYRRTGILSAAQLYLQEALEIEPNNTDLLNDLAECYMAMTQYDKALETYFKLDLKNEGDLKVQRQIVLSAFLAHNMETARKYMQIVLNHRKPTVADWSMAGCLALKDNDIKEMLNCFGHIGTLRSRLNGFDNNINNMNIAGVPRHLVTIARDALNKL